MYEWMKLIGLNLERDNVAAKIQEVLLAPDTQFPLEHNIRLMLRYYSCDAARFLLFRFPYSCIKNTDTFSRRLNDIVNTAGPGRSMF